jgi:hypothetical protein
MWVMILSLVVNGVVIQSGIRSEDGVSPMLFASKEACEKQIAQDKKDEPGLNDPRVTLVCEKR